MLRYLTAGISIGFIFYFYKTKRSRNIPPKKKTSSDHLYFYCNTLCKKYRNRMISNNIIKLKNNLNCKTIWLNNINAVNNEIYKKSSFNYLWQYIKMKKKYNGISSLLFGKK